MGRMCIAFAACQNTDNGDVTPPADTTAPETTAPVADTAAPEQSADPEPAGITVTDMMGREVTLDAPASKVVALSAGECEIVYALGAGELVVGRGEYCDYPAEVFDVASVKSGSALLMSCIRVLWQTSEHSGWLSIKSYCFCSFVSSHQ